VKPAMICTTRYRCHRRPNVLTFVFRDPPRKRRRRTTRLTSPVLPTSRGLTRRAVARHRRPRGPLSLEEILDRHVYMDPTTGCWIWCGERCRKSYSRFRKRQAHRFVYEAFGHWIPPGYHLDHVVCRLRPCVNPAHLEPVTPTINAWRACAVRLRRAVWGRDEDWPRSIDLPRIADPEWRCTCGAVNAVGRPCELCGTLEAA
jgi:hypothetical protein